MPIMRSTRPGTDNNIRSSNSARNRIDDRCLLSTEDLFLSQCHNRVEGEQREIPFEANQQRCAYSHTWNIPSFTISICVLEVQQVAIVLGPIIRADSSVRIVGDHLGLSPIGSNDKHIQNLTKYDGNVRTPFRSGETLFVHTYSFLLRTR
jgi:hypothetical protein